MHFCMTCLGRMIVMGHARVGSQGHEKPDKQWLSGGFSEDELQAQHAEKELNEETRRR